MTAFSHFQAKAQAKSVNFVDVLSKPLTASSLLDTIVTGLKINADSNSTKTLKNRSSTISFKGAKVLLAEDNEINQELATELLEEKGMVVTVANNGEEAINLVSQNDFDCVLMDCQMPIVDGYEASITIRKTLKKTDLPIIALTANAMESDVQQILDAGMNDRITKPIDVDAFYKTLSHWIAPSSKKEAVDLEKGKEKEKVNVILSDFDFRFLEAAEGQRIANNNMPLYLKLLKKFREQYQSFEGKIEVACRNEDNSEVLFLLHTIKGSAGNIGATKLYQLVDKLELTFKEQDPANNTITSSDIQPVLKALKGVFSEIDELLTQCQENKLTLSSHLSATKSQNLSGVEFNQQIKHLKKLIDDFNVDAVERCKDLMSRCDDKHHKDALANILIALDEFDFERARIAFIQGFE